MIFKKVYDFVLQGDNATEEKAKEIASGLVWGKVKTNEQDIKYCNYVDTINDVGIYYNPDIDYYFFVDEGEI